MASTGFKAIAQLAEILDRPEIDETARHFIMDLLTKTLGENYHLKTSMDEKNQEICDLRFDSRGYEDHNKLLLNENESLATAIHERNQTIKSLEDQLREKKWEIEDLQSKIQEQDDNDERALGETAEVIEKLLTEKDAEIEEHRKTIVSLGDQLREKEMMIRHDTKEIKKLRDELKEEEEDSEEEVEEEPRRRYVAPEYKLPYSGAGKKKFAMIK